MEQFEAVDAVRHRHHGAVERKRVSYNPVQFALFNVFAEECVGHGAGNVANVICAMLVKNSSGNGTMRSGIYSPRSPASPLTTASASEAVGALWFVL